MKLGISVALPGEIGCLCHGRESTPPTGIPFDLSDDVVAIHSGIGPERALAGGRKLLEKGATAILSWGCATALDEGLNPGTLLLPQIIFHADGQQSPVDESWHERLSHALAPMGVIATGVLAESPEILKNKIERVILGERTGALGADMESGALALAANEKGVPFLAIRAIADDADAQFPDFVSRSIDDWGRIKWLRFVIGASLNPGEWKALSNLNRCFTAAQTTLKEVSVHTGPDFHAFT